MNHLALTAIIILASLLTIMSMLYMAGTCYGIREECIDRCKDCMVVNRTLPVIPVPNLSALDDDGTMAP